MSRQSLEALQQIYGYMTFNCNKFGILTNWKRALFLRRSETSDRKTLEYYFLTKQIRSTNLDVGSMGWHGVTCRGQLVLRIPYSIPFPSGTTLWNLNDIMEGE